MYNNLDNEKEKNTYYIPESPNISSRPTRYEIPFPNVFHSRFITENDSSESYDEEEGGGLDLQPRFEYFEHVIALCEACLNPNFEERATLPEMLDEINRLKHVMRRRKL